VKRTIAILLSVIILFQLTGFMIIFKVKQNAIRKEIKHLIKNGVPQNELIVIELNSLNKNNFDWKHSREFSFKGDMYDIVRTDTINQNTFMFYCVNDIQEKELFANLDRMVSACFSEQTKQTDKQIDFSQLLTLKYIVPSLSKHSSKALSPLCNPNYLESHYQSPIIQLSEHPPQFFII
jgi:hypothetical protein